MSMLSWRLWRMRSRSCAVATATRAPRPRKLSLEVLEDRTLLSANTYTVTVSGDATPAVGTKDTSDPAGLSGDLRYVVTQADLAVNAGSTIVFNTAKASSLIVLSQGELRLSQNMTITGPGAGALTITGTSATGASRVFETNAGVTVPISGEARPSQPERPSEPTATTTTATTNRNGLTDRAIASPPNPRALDRSP